jgi:Chemotaxis protein; stimulates methylation of MCP proteins
VSDEQHVLRVRIGHYEVRGRCPQLLKATLGSCVGIAILWRQRARYALAHCLLPRSPQPAPGPGARYVDQAIASMLQDLEVDPPQYGELEVHVAGGGNMTQRAHTAGPASHIGQLNVEAAVRQLTYRGLAIHSEDVGGCHARQIMLDCLTEQVTVVRVPVPDKHD